MAAVLVWCFLKTVFGYFHDVCQLDVTSEDCSLPFLSCFFFFFFFLDLVICFDNCLLLFFYPPVFCDLSTRDAFRSLRPFYLDGVLSLISFVFGVSLVFPFVPLFGFLFDVRPFPLV